MTNLGVHHFHHSTRDRSNRAKRIIDKLVYVGGLFVVVMTLPQVWKIWTDKTAAGTSLATWLGYLSGSLFWAVYGLIHKEKPIIFINILTFILQLFIVLGILKYG